MSRVGKLPVAIPAGVEVSLTAAEIGIKGTGAVSYTHLTLPTIYSV